MPDSSTKPFAALATFDVAVLELKLRNFMCYRDDAEVLDLTGVHLACLSGETGAGKSALLEAITWVRWGRARDRGCRCRR